MQALSPETIENQNSNVGKHSEIIDIKTFIEQQNRDSVPPIDMKEPVKEEEVLQPIAPQLDSPTRTPL